MTRISRQHLDLDDAEEAEIQAQIAADPDDADITDDEIALARPFSEALPELMASITRARGRPTADSVKTPVTIRLDPDVVDYYRATGKGWQSRINILLRQAAGL